jgi:hypothetical protein
MTPLAFLINNGSPPTERNALTGLFTPPGINKLAFLKAARDFVVFLKILLPKTIHVWNGHNDYDHAEQKELPLKVKIPLKIFWALALALALALDAITSIFPLCQSDRVGKNLFF